MKTNIAEILGMALFVGGAYAQGTVSFLNINAGAGVNAPVRLYLWDQTSKLTGPAWMAGLFSGPTSTSLAYIGNATPFLTGAGAGYFNGGTTTLAGFPGGAVAWLQVVAWDSTLRGTTTGATWAQAIADDPVGIGGVWGMSKVFSVVVSDPNTSPPQIPAALVGLQSFAIIWPEPSTVSLSGLGLAAVLLFRRRK